MENLRLFFATRNDLLMNIKRLETELELHYALVGQFEKKQKDHFSSLLDIKGLGTTSVKEVRLCQAYLVLPKNVNVKSQWEFVPQKGIQYSYYQDKNPKSIVVRLGGLYGNQCLLAGEIDTISEARESITLFNFFSKLLTQKFSKIKGYYVGPEAYEMLTAGKRLVTIGLKSSKEYDLSLT
ncbi:MAG: hypothetical protein Q3M24_11200 [Candidatus Electrothrix aestuarii]|uniref:Uncharacterized protein n=1 Tax=Candidatus Electrothrix aestuarii TaxID=3062594 RepID=A0AAU8M2C7_9BACT|nr:hypothetical protein [Candidatus Electrothrix aestuarii]